MAGRGFILALDDADITALVAERIANGDSVRFELLFDRFRLLLS